MCLLRIIDILKLLFVVAIAYIGYVYDTEIVDRGFHYELGTIIPGTGITGSILGLFAGGLGSFMAYKNHFTNEFFASLFYFLSICSTLLCTFSAAYSYQFYSFLYYSVEKPAVIFGLQVSGIGLLLIGGVLGHLVVRANGYLKLED